MLNHVTNVSLQTGGAQTPIWNGVVNWTVVVPTDPMDLVFSGDVYFAHANISDIVTVAASTSPATTPASTTTAPSVTTTAPPTTTPLVTVTADPSVQNQLNSLTLTNFTAVQAVVELVISTLSPTLSPLDAQALIEATLQKLLGAIQLLQPASKSITVVKKFISNSNVLAGLTGKSLGSLIDIVGTLTKPLDLASGNDIVSIFFVPSVSLYVD